MSQDEGTGPTFDEAFIEGATIHEPSAKHREYRAKQRAWARAAQPPASPRDWQAAAPRRRVSRPVLTTLAIVALVAGVSVWLSNGRWFPLGGNPAEVTPVRNGPVPAKTTLSMDQPFDGSPAAGYADGAKGIHMPVPAAMGDFSKKQVDRTLRQVKALVVAAQLDRRTLRGGSPDAYVARLDPYQRGDFVKNLNAPDPRYRTRSQVMSFAPGTAKLAGDEIKVNGSSGAEPHMQWGRTGILVKVNYLFVYPIYRPGHPETLTRLVAHYEASFFHYRTESGEHTWVVSAGSSQAPARCDVSDGFVHPFYPDYSAADRKVSDGPSVDPYSLKHEPQDGFCRVTGRT
jgi:hypothetical protein